MDATFNKLLSFHVTLVEKPFTTPYNMRRFAIADPDGYNLSFHGPVPKQ